MNLIKFPRLGIACLIVFYQRWVSPFKGFCCAYKVRYGEDSCSEWARKTVLEIGVLRFPVLLYQRFKACGQAYAQLAEDQEEENPNKDNEAEPCPCYNRELAVCCGSAAPCYWT